MGAIAESIRRKDWETINKRVEGFGIYDSIYKSRVIRELPKVNGKRVRKEVWVCPVYRDWKKLLYRVFNKGHLKSNPSYIGTTVDNSWYSFCNFYEWVHSQPNKYWQNCDLDKDFLSGNNKHYGPETCVYIPQELNKFITTNKRGDNLIGVSVKKGRKIMKYRARCSNPFTKEVILIGHYSDEMEAHLAWKAYKHSLALEYVKMGLDPRVEKVLITKFSPESDLTCL